MVLNSFRYKLLKMLLSCRKSRLLFPIRLRGSHLYTRKLKSLSCYPLLKAPRSDFSGNNYCNGNINGNDEIQYSLILLGSPLGSDQFCIKFLDDLITQLKEEAEKIKELSNTQSAFLTRIKLIQELTREH